MPIGPYHDPSGCNTSSECCADSCKSGYTLQTTTENCDPLNVTKLYVRCIADQTSLTERKQISCDN